MITIVGLGPAGFDRLSPDLAGLLRECERVISRTLEHPAALELSRMREVESCDDIYLEAEDFDAVYSAIADRVLAAGTEGDVVYAVPGSPAVGERSVAEIRRRAEEAGVAVRVRSGSSFLDELFVAVGVDPLASGLQVLDARSLPYPLLLGLPTVFAQVDTSLVAGGLKGALLEVLEPDHLVTVASGLGGSEAVVRQVLLGELDHVDVGPRTSVFVDPGMVGWPGLVEVSRRLRAECPWDAKQTHHSLVRHLIEEAYEVIEAVSQLAPEAPAGEVDVPAYLHLEEELGDLLLQVLFHSNLASEAGVFGIDNVAEQHRRKLIHRHPHVFGVDGGEPIEVDGAQEVEANWERIKQQEKDRDSLMDDVPVDMPALARGAKLQRRAASVGFDWPDQSGVMAKLREEVAELDEALEEEDGVAHELGDVLFTVVNLARHLDIDPEMALRQAVDRFSERFRKVEKAGDLAGRSAADLNALWEQAKGS
ncbi:MAG: nucleoside triphosphate pyrophosphohydrolase [Acidimicrobiia bacterium]